MTAATLSQRPDTWKYQPRSIEGKRVIVTGGTTGSGRSIALLLASLGAKVLIFGRHEKPLQEALQTLASYEDRVFGLTADASKEADLDVVFEAADEKLGGLDILINNAGLPAGSVLDSPADEYRYVIETNLLGYMAAARRAVPRIKKAGGGAIVNVGSMSAEKKGPGSDAYTAGKNGLRGFSEALSKQVHPDHIHVGLIEPGNFGADFRYEEKSEHEQKHAKGAQMTSEEVAEAVLFMLTTPADCHIPFLQVEPLHDQGG